MSKVYITITGTKYFFGQEFLEPKMEVTLKKEHDNEYDSEAIAVEVEGMGRIGHVANSPRTVMGESMSAGRLYDRIGETAKADIMYVFPQGVLCRVREESILYDLERVCMDDFGIEEDMPFH